METGDAFSSWRIAPRHRCQAIRSAWTNLLGLDIEPGGRTVPDVAIHRKMLPGLGLARLEGSGTTFVRTEEQARRSGDDVILCMARGAEVAIRTRLGDIAVFPEGSMHVWNADRAMWGAVDHAYRAILLSVPRPRLERAGVDLDPVTAAGGIARPRPEAKLLSRYAGLVFDTFDDLNASARRTSLDHLTDLIVLALGPGSPCEGQLTAVKAARLAALKRDIADHLGEPELSPAWLASRHGIGTRYLRALFAAEQTSFTDFVRDQRLIQARRLLMAAGSAGLGISDIAYRCGFGDLSYFNRVFRQRFGMTPSDVRSDARRAPPGSAAQS